MPNSSIGSEYWLARAEEARIMAEQMRHPNARLTMLRIAQVYTRMAERLQDDPEDLKPAV
jgi:hypothetical protein